MTLAKCLRDKQQEGIIGASSGPYSTLGTEGQDWVNSIDAYHHALSEGSTDQRMVPTPDTRTSGMKKKGPGHGYSGRT